MEDAIVDRRKSIRFSTLVKAHYLYESEQERKECTITDISHGGMKITLQLCDKIRTGLIINLQAFFCELTSPTRLEGSLKWFEQKGDDFIGGIELNCIKENADCQEILG